MGKKTYTRACLERSRRAQKDIKYNHTDDVSQSARDVPELIERLQFAADVLRQKGFHGIATILEKANEEEVA